MKRNVGSFSEEEAPLVEAWLKRQGFTAEIQVHPDTTGDWRQMWTNAPAALVQAFSSGYHAAVNAALASRRKA